jgi:hypothetical protein
MEENLPNLDEDGEAVLAPFQSGDKFDQQHQPTHRLSKKMSYDQRESINSIAIVLGDVA